MLANRMQYWAEINVLLPEEQNAFRLKRSTMEHIFILKAVIDQRISKKKKAYVAFVDLEKAYDSVNHEILWSKLQLLGLPPRLINTIRMIYQSMAIVQIGTYKIAEPIKINKGVLQGDPMSSILFNLFLSDYDNKMKLCLSPKITLYYSKREINYLQFADDIVLVAENRLY